MTIPHPTKTMATELTPSAFEVLRSAVREARDGQIKTLVALRERLALMFPCRSQDIDQAIGYWSAQVRRNGVHE